MPPAEAVVSPAGAIVAWLSGVTLLLAVSLSVYAVARPPTLRRDAGSVIPVARYSFADFVNLAR